jgi:hypothetical protein
MTEDVRKALEFFDACARLTDGAKAKIRDGSGLRHGWALAAEVRRREGQNCETCRFQWVRESGCNLCGLVSIPGHSVARVACSSLNNGCNAWQPRAAQTGQGE